MSGFVELTQYRRDHSLFVRADAVVAVVGLPARDAVVSNAMGPMPAAPARTVVTLAAGGDRWETVCLETAEEVMSRVRAAS